MLANFVLKIVNFFLAASRLRRDRAIRCKSVHCFAHPTSGFSLLSLAGLLLLNKVSSGLRFREPSSRQFWQTLSLNNKLILANHGLCPHEPSSRQFWRTLSLNNKLIPANRGLCPHKPSSHQFWIALSLNNKLI